MATLGGNADARSSVIEAVNQTLPGILQDASGQGLIDPDQLVLDSAVNLASVVSALILLWTAVSIMTNIRSAVQAMFGIVAPVENFALQKLRDLGGFAAMALGIVTSALLGTAAGTMGRAIMDALGLGDNPVAAFFVRLGGLLVAAAVATLTFIFLFRVTAAVRPLRRDLLAGSAVGGVAVQVILFLGTSVVSSVSDNPLLAASASIATLLLFVNLLSRVLLMVAAFTANPPAPEKPQSAEEVHFNEQPNYVTRSAPHTLDWKYQDVTGQLDVDESLRPGRSAAARSAHGRRRTPRRHADPGGRPGVVGTSSRPEKGPGPRTGRGGAAGPAGAAATHRGRGARVLGRRVRVRSASDFAGDPRRPSRGVGRPPGRMSSALTGVDGR